MRKLAVGGVAATMLLVAGFAAAAGSRGPDVRAPVRIHVIEDATTDTEVDADGSGGTSDSTGDLLTFHNQIFNACGANPCPRVGHDLGHCVLIVPGRSYHCIWTTFLAVGNQLRGQIAVEGLFSFKNDTTLAIVGGTGSFANARGTMELRSRAGGTKFDFIFNVLP